ncbi:hypothetical protein AWN76_016025 [Rhodothermaceae bacterium RA]|nr:hypothetical protein AWN76_016025 [Rhodothermaceae bacterium RA]
MIAILSLSSRRRRIGFGLALLLVAAVGVALVRIDASRAYGGMPEAYRVYWNWVGRLSQGDSMALRQGVELLFEYPDLRPLYLQLAETCRQADRLPDCREAMRLVQPAEPAAVLYQQVALHQLDPEADLDAADGLALAGHPALDPTLARWLVDEAGRAHEAGREALAAIWQTRLASDSTAAAAAFGLGYLAVQQRDWAAAERYLVQATRIRPDDPEAYRELGRIYYLTGRPDRFEAALTDGIRAAEAQYDLKKELILRGNLGWGLMQRSGRLDQAAQVFEEAIAQSRMLADGETEGINLYRLALVRYRQFRYQDALDLLDRADEHYAVHLPQRRSDVLALRGTVLGDMVRLEEAERTLHAAIEDARAQGHASAHVNASIALAQLQYRMGRYEAADATARQALARAETYDMVDAVIGAHMVLGDLAARHGDFREAEQHYRAGLEQAEKTKSDSRIRELYRRLGRMALTTHDARRAQFYYEKLLETTGPDQGERAEIYLGLGDTYARFGNRDKARQYYDQALTHLGEGGNRHLRVNALLARAWVEIEGADYETAAATLQAVRPLVADDAGGRSRLEAALGNLYLAQGRYGEALRHLRRAAAVPVQMQRPATRWHLLHGQALAYWHLGQRAAAEEAFLEAIRGIESLRSTLDAAEDRAFFVQNKTRVFDNYAAFLEEQGRLEEALYYTERARSRSLVDLLYTTQRGRELDATRLTDQAIEMDRRLRALAQELRWTALEPASEAEDAPEATTRASYLRREYERTDSLYRQVSLRLRDAERMYVFDPIVPDSVQALLRPDEAMIVYNLHTLERGGRPEPRSLAYIVHADGVHLQRLEVDDETVREAVRFFRSQISTGEGTPGTGWQPTARRLYADLVAPLLPALPPGIRHLHLVPEGALHYLPFAALQDEQGRFLVERFSLSVVPSATVLALSRRRNPRRWRSMLLVADPAGRLPGARQEVRAIAARATSRRIVLEGARATQANLEERAPAYDILHLATHGQFVSQAPWRSYLELADGPFHVDEIGRLRLDAYLVTLSACETALSGGLLSDIPDGDEWIGLNQAFLAAGTPTVMASLWAIDDEVSSPLMIGFYDRLGPEGKAHALATMQRRFIQDPATRHPFYWAAFTVIGDPL